MDFAQFKSALSDLRRSKQRLEIIILIQLIVIVLLIVVFWSKDSKVVLTPPYLSGETYEIYESRANAAYLKSWGLHVATLRGNFSPSSVDFVVESLSQLMNGRLWRDTREQIKAEAIAMKEEGISADFEPRSIEFHAGTNRVFVTGLFTETTARGVTHSREITYETKLSIRWGRPQVLDLQVYEGGPPDLRAR